MITRRAADLKQKSKYVSFIKLKFIKFWMQPIVPREYKFSSIRKNFYIFYFNRKNYQSYNSEINLCFIVVITIQIWFSLMIFRKKKEFLDVVTLHGTKYSSWKGTRKHLIKTWIQKSLKSIYKSCISQYMYIIYNIYIYIYLYFIYCKWCPRLEDIAFKSCSLGLVDCFENLII